MDDDSLLDDFINESRDHLSTIERDLMALENGAEPELVNRLFRAMHSMKGGAGFLSLTAINAVAHRAETLLDQVRSGRMAPGRPMIDLLLQAADTIAALVEQGRAGAGADVVDLCGRLDAMMHAQAPVEAPQAASGPAVVLSGPRPWASSLSVPAAALAHRDADHPLLMGLRFTVGGSAPLPAATTTSLKASGEILAISHAGGAWIVALATPMPEEVLVSLFDLPGEDVTALEQPAAEESRPQTVLIPAAHHATTPALTPAKPATVATPAPSTERHGGTGSAAMASGAPAATPAAPGAATEEAASTVRIHVGILDQLMTLAGELVLIRNQQLLAAANATVEQRAQIQRLDAITTSLQEAIMRTRLQPIGNLFSRFPRVIRDLATKLGKKINLNVTGNEVELDRSILEALADPLKHLVRNACDHGMETPDRRIANGKPEAGTVSLTAWHEGGQVNIELRDDGPGIDPARIRKKALEKGLKTAAELEAMGEKEVLRLILLPGFSTAEQVTDVSGRGVGMDVVSTAIENLGGTLDIRSGVGKGSVFHLRLPLTLAILPSLIVECGGRRYAIPQTNVDELVGLDDAEAVERIESAGDQEVFRLRGHLLPLVRLDEVLKRPQHLTARDRIDITRSHRGVRRETTFAVVRSGTTPFGLIVDQVIGTEEIVVKPMHPALKKLGCYAGATVMGDGSVALILAVEGLAAHAGVEPDRSEANETVDEHDRESQTLLLFAGGQDERFAVALPLIRRVERILTKDIQRVGGAEFVPVDGKPTAIIRLDRHLPVSPPDPGATEAFLLLPKHLSKPVGILAARIIDTVSAAVSLTTEALPSNLLLGTTLIDGKMTLFPDLYRLAGAHDPSHAPERSQRSARILLAEDTAFFRQLIRGYLEGLGHHVTVAHDGEDAVAILGRETFDLVVSDLEMPRCDGWEMVRRLRQDLRLTTPALAVSTLGDDRSIRRAIDAGFDRYEQKMDPPRFTAAVNDLLAGRTATLVNGKEAPRV